MKRTASELASLLYASFFALLPMWVFLKYSESPEWILFSPTLLKEGVLIGIASIVLITAYREQKTGLPITRGWLIFFCIVLISAFRVLPHQPVQGMIYWLRPYIEMPILITVPILVVKPSIHLQKQMISGVLIGGTITILIALVHAFIDPSLFLSPGLVNSAFKGVPPLAYYGDRLQSFTGNPNTLGIIGVLTSIISSSYLLERENYRGEIIFATIGLCSIIVVGLTRSRDDFLLLAITLGVLAVLLKNKLIIITGLASGVIAFLLNANQVLLAVSRLTTNEIPRITSWQAALDYWFRDLVFGTGRVPQRYLNNYYLDNLYLEMAFHLSILGVGAFICSNISIIGKNLQILYNPDCAGMGQSVIPSTTIVLLIAVLIGSFFRVAALGFPLSSIYWLLVALAITTIVNAEAKGEAHD